MSKFQRAKAVGVPEESFGTLRRAAPLPARSLGQQEGTETNSEETRSATRVGD